MPAMRGQAFCRAHIGKPVLSPLSGAEPDFDPDLWNVKRDVRETHNCFAYALNIHDPRQIARCRGKPECNAPYPQPGSASGHEGFANNIPKTCPNLLVRIQGDNPNITRTDFESTCPTGTSKIALIVDESDDYHFARQDSDGYWSHKPGGTRVTAADAFGHRIARPDAACFNYKAAKKGDLNYNIFCSYMCVPRNQPLYMKAGGMFKRLFS